jgi:hypothetical protein
VAAPETLWPAAVSERSAALLHGPPRPAVVLGAFPTALYLRLGDHAAVLPVVTADGLRLPTALAVARPLPTVGWGVQPGDEVMVGDGAVPLPGATIRAVRTWRPQPVRPAPGRIVPAALLPPVRLTWRTTARTVTAGLLADRSSGHPAPAAVLAARVATLVGAGPGLTPSGDDVLCGILLGLRLGCDTGPLVDTLWAAVRPRLSTTTSLSAALLTEAAAGYAVAPVVRLTRALADAQPAVVAEALHAVLDIGHSSGADLLGGLAGCLDALAHDALAHDTGTVIGHTPPLDHTPALATTPRSLL